MQITTHEKSHEKKKLSFRWKKKVPAIDAISLTPLQALVLKEISLLGSKSTGFSILSSLSRKTGVYLCVEEVFQALRALRAVAFVEDLDARKKAYRVTPKGGVALSETIAHHRDLLMLLDMKKNN